MYNFVISTRRENMFYAKISIIWMKKKIYIRKQLKEKLTKKGFSFIYIIIFVSMFVLLNYRCFTYTHTASTYNNIPSFIPKKMQKKFFLANDDNTKCSLHNKKKKTNRGQAKQTENFLSVFFCYLSSCIHVLTTPS